MLISNAKDGHRHLARRVLGGLLGSTLMLASGAVAAQGTERLNEYLQNLTTLQSEFEQTLYDERKNELERSKGTLYLSRPNRFRWDYALPVHQEIVSDGKKVWIYDSELLQVTVRPAAEAVGSTPARLLSSNEPVEKDFVVQDVPGEGTLSRVQLTPRDSEAGFESISLSFEGTRLALIELLDTFGQTTRLRFWNTQRNLGLAPDLFDFTPPPGTDVVGEP